MRTKFITEQEAKSLKSVNHTYIDDIFKEALVHDKTLLIDENKVVKKGNWFRADEHIVTYTILHEIRNKEGVLLEAQYIEAASGNSKTVAAYLYGIINGAEAIKKTTQITCVNCKEEDPEREPVEEYDNIVPDIPVNQYDKLKHGSYFVFWRTGGQSVVSVGSTRDGERWMMPSNWTSRDTVLIKDEIKWITGFKLIQENIY